MKVFKETGDVLQGVYMKRRISYLRQLAKKGKPLGFFKSLSVLLLILLLLSSCASTTNTKGKGGETDRQVSSIVKDKTLIEKIRLEYEDDGEKIKIVGSTPIAYTAFKLTDPERLIIDMPDVVFKDIISPITVHDGVVKEINTHTYPVTSGNIGRVEIEIEDDIEYGLEMKGNTLFVGLKKEIVKEAPQEELPEVFKDAALPVPTQDEEIASDDGKSVDNAIEKPLKKAENIVSLDVSKADEYNIVSVKGDGAIGNYNTFTLDDPKRFVLDLWGVNGLLNAKDLKVGSSFIKRVRIGENPQRLRIVLDIEGADFPPAIVNKAGEHLNIIIGNAESAKNALPVTEEPDVLHVGKVKAAEPVRSKMAIKAETQEPAPQITPYRAPEASMSNNLKSVDFKETNDSSLVIVRTSMSPDYRLSKSFDGETVALTIKNTSMPQDLQRTLDASELDTVVSSVSSYPSRDSRDVTILVKLKEQSAPKIVKDRGGVIIKFPRPTVLNVVSAVPEATHPPVSPKPPLVEEKEISEPPIRLEQTVAENEIVSKSTDEEDGSKRYLGRKISLDVKDADIQNIFRLIAEVSHLNVVVADEVKGKITMRLMDVPWDQALDIILKTKGLGMVLEGNIMRIASTKKLAAEEKRLLEQKKAKEKLEDLSIKLVSVNFADAKDLQAKVKDLLSDRGSVTVDDRTNTLVIKDIQANIDKAVSLIEKLDTSTPQVLIEARIVEAQSTFARDLGVQWGVDTGLKGAGKTQVGAFGSSSTSGLSAPSNLQSLGLDSNLGTSNLALSLPASGSAGPLGAIGFTFGKLTGDPLLIDLKLSAGEVKGLSKTISRPRIITLDNKEAKISQGDSVPFETVSDSGTQTQFIDATLELTVTPHITPDGSVVMKIKASRNSIGSFRSSSGTPSISKKEASTEIIVRDGETAVIGGIVVSDKSDNLSGVPALYKVPVLGWLFKNKSLADTQTELLIFITPKIVKN